MHQILTLYKQFFGLFNHFHVILSSFLVVFVKNLSEDFFSFFRFLLLKTFMKLFPTFTYIHITQIIPYNYRPNTNNAPQLTL